MHAARQWTLRTALLITAVLALVPSTAVRGQDPIDRAYQASLDSCSAAENAGDYGAALDQLKVALSLATADHDPRRKARVLVRRGVILQRRGDYNAALNDFYDALKLLAALRDEDGLAEVYNNIGSIHHYDKNYAKAYEYYELSARIRERNGTPAQRALLYNNFGSLLEDRGKPDSALYHLRRGLAIHEQLGDSGWVAVFHANIGSCQMRLGHADSARTYYQSALAMLRGSTSRYLRANVSMRLGTTYLEHGPVGEAMRWCSAGLEIARELKVPPLMQRCCDCLYKANLRAGRTAKALAMLEESVSLRDSVFSQERMKELTRIELNHLFERRQVTDSLERAVKERQVEANYQRGLDRQINEKRLFMVGGTIFLMVAGGLWSRLRYVRRSRNTIERERERSDRLLLNILPKRIAEELKERGEALARDVDGVSILFTDFFDFTPLSERMSAQELVAEINTCFKAFDNITARHGLEKIKTIGDAYMAAGGLPEPRPDSARDTVLAALEMQAWLSLHQQRRFADHRQSFSMRVGIHTGPVVAGIVGHTKFQYDIWGDTVNIAARTETTSEVGQVNITGATYALVKDTPGLVFTPRGFVEVKGKGMMEMFFVHRSRTAA